jgi:cytochrome c553
MSVARCIGHAPMRRNLPTIVLLATGCGRPSALGDAPPLADAPIDIAIDAAIDAAPDAMPDAPIDAIPIDAPIDAGPPTTLFDTGLCVDPACTAINPGIRAYTPRWTLWADAASKRRWIYLPPGQTIDTRDMNAWRFPQGTKLWKEFSVGSVRVETRFYAKLGPTEADWYAIAFVWNAAQTQAVAAPSGQANANGTTHDVPSQAVCRECHERTVGRVLGFSALQLDVSSPGQLDLASLVQAGQLSNSPAGSASPFFPLPPDAQPRDTAAIGYLHANCGHCHHEGNDVFMIVPRIFLLDVNRLASLAQTWTYITTIDQTPSIAIPNGTYVVDPGNTAQSELFIRFTSTDSSIHMPPVATETIDPTGRQILSNWISGM